MNDLKFARILDEQVTLRTAQLEEAYRDTVHTLVRAAEYRDSETGHHVRRISHYCRMLAKAMDLPSEFQDAIFVASPMHDIGKIGIPDHVRVIEIIARGDGRTQPEHFDPVVLACFAEQHDRFATIYDQLGDA